MKPWKITAVLCLCVPMWGQGVRIESNVFTSANNVPPGSQSTMYTVPYAQVTVCAYPDDGGQPCTNTVPIFQDAALTVSQGQPITADVHGRYGFWIASGTYTYSVVAPSGGFLGTFVFNAGGGGSYTLPVAQPSTLGGIKPDNSTITVDPSTGIASSAGGLSGQTANCAPKANSTNTANGSMPLCDDGATTVLTHPLSVPSVAATGTGAGNFALGQGAVPGTTANSVTLAAPAAVTAPSVITLPAGLPGSNGLVLSETVSGSQVTTNWVASSGSGTVTSVAQTVPSWLAVSGSPITTSGTLAISAATGQTSHEVVGTCGTATSVSLCPLVAADLPATPLTTGTSVTLAAPRQYFVCTTTCTVTAPVPAAGYEFCVMNDDNVSTVITLAAIGSSARYENTARTAYGTAGTGTLVSGGAVADKVCIVGRDSTHYLTASFSGTWTAN